MLSMIEKIKAAGLNKPPLGDAPLNLSAMLDNNGHNDNSEESDKTNSGSVSPDNNSEAVAAIKQENGIPESDNIRAQFFADLKRLKNNDTSGLTDSPTTTDEAQDKSPSQHSVTLKIREDEDVLPPRKRKIDVIGNGGDDSGDCKKVAHDDDLESSIKLETTSY